jgi:hypothetical protein
LIQRRCVVSEDRGEGPRFLDWIRDQMIETGASNRVEVKPFTVNGVALHIRTLTAEQYAWLYQGEEANPADTVGRMVRLVAAGACDADGGPIITTEGVRLLTLDIAQRIADAVAELNGIPKGG